MILYLPLLILFAILALAIVGWVASLVAVSFFAVVFAVT